MKVSNGVLHTFLGRSRRSYAVDVLTGGCTPATLPYSPTLGEVTTLKRGPPYTHYRIQTPLGPLLLFRTGSIIRAGGQPLSTSAHLVIATARWLTRDAQGQRIWPSAIACPNLVLFGKLPAPPPQSLGDHPLAHKSGRFPGTAIRLPTGATPEVFKSGKFILPGANSVTGITDTLNALARVLEEAEAPTNT